MPFIQENSLGLLGRATVNMQNGDGKSIAYTVPTGKIADIYAVKISKPTASLAGGSDFDIGSGANADTWKQTNDLSTMTAATNYMYIISSGVKYTQEVAGAAFGIKPITGATADAQATMEVFGIESDA
jgi:hypothetical protein